MCGSSQTCEHVFSLLRWIANRPNHQRHSQTARLSRPKRNDKAGYHPVAISAARLSGHTAGLAQHEDYGAG